MRVSHGSHYAQGQGFHTTQERPFGIAAGLYGSPAKKYRPQQPVVKAGAECLMRGTETLRRRHPRATAPQEKEKRVRDGIILLQQGSPQRGACVTFAGSWQAPPPNIPRRSIWIVCGLACRSMRQGLEHPKPHPPMQHQALDEVRFMTNAALVLQHGLSPHPAVRAAPSQVLQANHCRQCCYLDMGGANSKQGGLHE